MPELPTGILTFLFTDIIESTRLWEQFPQQMEQAHARHAELVIAGIKQHHGHLVRERGEGDSTFSVFERPLDALLACCAFQKALHAEDWPADTPIAVRAALHIGDAHLREDDYNSTDVNRCAHLRGIAHGGQTVLSQAVYEAVRDALPDGVTLRDLGWHGLKNLRGAEHAWQMCHPALRGDFPPLQSLNTPFNNLPCPPGNFIGRDAEMQTIRALTRAHPLVTLTGAGGVGKTRLALQAAAESVGQYEHGVWLVELAALTDAALVPQALGSVLGLCEEPGQSLAQTVTNHLAARHILIILDNCEHLLDACAALAESLLRACPRMTLLATSREALNIAGEHVWRVPSLAVPDDLPAEEKDGPAILMKYDAARLFVERARSHRQEFTLTRHNAPIIARLCRRLDGIPLALELAAARLRALPLEQIEARLNDRFRLLTGGSRSALPRQQTLRALIDWSYDLLNPQEKALFCRLSVFAGGWTPEAAEAVCIEEGETWDVMDTLASLADKSLVICDPQSEQSRYRMLETTREYSRACLDAPTLARLRVRHRRFFLPLAEQAKTAMQGPEQENWLDRLEQEYANLRAALDNGADEADEADEAEARLRLSAALVKFWQIRGYAAEGMRYYALLLAQPDAQALTEARGNALIGAGSLALVQGDFGLARAHFENALAVWQARNNAPGCAGCLGNLGVIAKYRGDYALAGSLLEQALQIIHAQGDLASESSARNNLGILAWEQGDYEAARVHYQASLEIDRQRDNKYGLASSLTNLGALAERQGDIDGARDYFRQSLVLQRELGDKWGLAGTLVNLGPLALKQGNTDDARAFLAECLRLCAELDDRHILPYALEAWAAVALARQEPEHAAQCCGAAQTLRKTSSAPLPPQEQQEHDQLVATLRAALGEAAFEAGCAQGGSLPLQQVIADALAR